MPDLATGAVVFVTGGASGIGRAAAQQFSPRRSHVVVADLDIDGAEDTAASLAGPGSSIELDVTDDTAVAARSTALSPSTADSTLRSTTQASTTRRALPRPRAASWDRMIRVNLSSVFV